jgi:hypothetical protein
MKTAKQSSSPANNKQHKKIENTPQKDRSALKAS